MTETQTAPEQELAAALITALNLEGKSAGDIDPTAPLFGFDANQRGLGLDSIDALEIPLMIQVRYGVQLRSDDAEVKKSFASLRLLTAHVEQRRKS